MKVDLVKTYHYYFSFCINRFLPNDLYVKTGDVVKTFEDMYI